MLRELGHPAVPVPTTVHVAQILEEFPRDSIDLPLTMIVTPEKIFPGAATSKGSKWHRLGSAVGRRFGCHARTS